MSVSRVTPVKVFENGEGDTALADPFGYIDFNSYDMEFDTQAQAIAWLEANNWTYVGEDKVFS